MSYGIEYASYKAMRQRCAGIGGGSNAQKYYVNRNITICDRWLNGDGVNSGYECFVADMGVRPSRAYSIDRIDRDGNYEKGNCRWATDTEQSLNRPDVIKVVIGSETVSLLEASKRFGISYPTVISRIKKRGLSVMEALSRPVYRPNSRARS